MQWKNCISCLVLVMAVLLAPVASPAATVDHARYGQLLKKFNINGLVDYDGLKAEHAGFKQYLKSLAAVNPDDLSQDEAYAYYINLYNAATIDLVLDNYPGIDSIKDIGGFFGSPWRKEFIELKGEKVTLDHIEHDILRPVYKDPRVHFAVNCASMGCPLLHDEPLEGPTLDETLDMLTRNHMRNTKFTWLEGGTLYVSKVFDWFGGDWGSDEDKIAFVQKYAGQELKAALEKLDGDVKLKYANWDWSLNNAKGK